MLILKSFEGVKYNLTTKPEHIIGRYGCDIVIQNDCSISRQHASIKVSVKGSQFHVELCDVGSKHGTFVNEGIESTTNSIPKESAINLNVGDRVRFGVKFSVWTLQEEKFVIYAPSMSAQNKSMTNKLMAKMNGTIVSELSKDCTHLTMDEVALGNEVACALAFGKPIVTFNYWKQFAVIFSGRKEQPIPNYVEYIPSVSTAQYSSDSFDFRINTSRRTLFKNLQFVAFGEEQYANVSPMIEAAGGKVIDGTSKPVGLSMRNVIVLQAKKEIQTETIKTYLDLLKKQKRRTISEFEIALSIAVCSRERYCNPLFDITDLLKQGTPAVGIDDATVLVEDSQNITEADTDIQECATGSNNFSLNVDEQNRVMSDEDDNFVVQNSPPIVEESSTSRSGLKRKWNDAGEERLLKNSKLDSFVVRKTATDDTNRSDSLGLSKTTTATKNTKDLFSFHDSTKGTGRNTRSLFAGVQNRVTQHSSSLFEKSSVESASSFVPDSLKKSEEADSPLSRRSSRSLFAKQSVGSSEMESMVLFSSHTETINDSMDTRIASKRKNVDSEASQSTSKKRCKTSTLFGWLSDKKKGKEVTRMDSDEEVDSALNETPTELTVPRTPKRNMTMPSVVVPTTVNLNHFVQAHASRSEVKQDPDADISDEIKDMLNKTVLHSVPLLKTNSAAMPSERVNDSRINFKKFHKTSCAKTSDIIPVTALIRFESKRENCI